jgi:hypothetical protein
LRWSVIARSEADAAIPRQARAAVKIASSQTLFAMTGRTALVHCVSHCEERSDAAIPRQERTALNIAIPQRSRDDGRRTLEADGLVGSKTRQIDDLA